MREAADGVADVLAALNQSAASMQAELEATKAKTRDLIRQTSALQAEGQALAEQVSNGRLCPNTQPKLVPLHTNDYSDDGG